MPRRLRAMTTSDVDAVLAVQEPGAVRGLAEVFDKAAHPFPRDAVARRWREEIEDPGVDCLVALEGDVVVGFAATRGDELLHVGTAVDTWGTGLATWLHDEVLARLTARGTSGRGCGCSPPTGAAGASTTKLGWQTHGRGVAQHLRAVPRAADLEPPAWVRA